jgi:type I restriction enzyme R subunit
MTTPAQSLNEATVENTALSWFADLDYEVRHGEEIAPGGSAAERDSYAQVLLVGRLRDAVERLNPDIPAQAREEAIRKVLYPESRRRCASPYSEVRIWD